MSEITDDNDKNALWLRNHQKICNVIVNYLNRYHAMPHIYQIANDTGISRQTIHKHIKEFRQSQDYKDYKDQQKIVESRIVGTIMNAALLGDMKAARLYFELSGELKTGRNTTNNFIQINNTILTDDILKMLPVERIERIEQAVKNGLAELIACR